MEIGQPLHIRFSVPPMALLKLSSKLLLDGFRTIPCLQPLSVGLILNLDIGQNSQCSLKLGQKAVRIPGSL
jgi:hypothetical protein